VSGSRTGGGGVGGTTDLQDRQRERIQLDQMMVAARSGDSQVLVVRGDAGIGKTALLDYVVESSSEVHILRALGVESDMELAYAALHQMCAPLLHRLTEIPAPQREALETVLGIRRGSPPDRFLVGLAALSLLSSAADEQPLLCVVDDAQWLDQASAQVLGFVARRLLAEPIVLLFGARSATAELAGLPELEVQGLADVDALALLDSVTGAPLDPRIRDRIVAETQGNPLALLELPRGLSMTQMAGGFGLLRSDTLPGRIEQSFLARIEELPEETRLLLLLAAAEPVGDPVLLWGAAERLGVLASAADPGGVDGLLRIDERVTFRHPLVRSAVYRAATPDGRRAAHTALAAAIDAAADPERHAWHRAAATTGPDEMVAAELESAAERGRARGGLAAAAAFMKRSAALTSDVARRDGRTISAARTSMDAGDFAGARRLLNPLRHRPLNEQNDVEAELLQGQLAFAAGPGRDAPVLLLSAARRLERLDLDAARQTYLTAWGAAVFAGDGERPEVLTEICRAALALPASPSDPRPVDLLLESLALLILQGGAGAAGKLREAARVFATDEISLSDTLHWASSATAASNAVWDFHTSAAIARRHVETLRQVGALGQLPVHLTALASATAWLGDFAETEALISEAAAVAAATGTRLAPYAELRLRSLQGNESATTSLASMMIDQAAAHGQGLAATTAHWSTAVLHNGLAHYEAAAEAATRATSGGFDPWVAMWALPELIEATVRLGAMELAQRSLTQLATFTEHCETDLADGVTVRSRAVLEQGGAADALYLAAIESLVRADVRPELARAHLLYGEWLRRQGRRIDARAQLRTSYDLFVAIGLKAFAERARRELMATGEIVRKRTVEASATDQLTPQEQQIALLVRDGLSNPEVGARLFLSPRTVEWHLRQVFAKLSISSRRQLRDVWQGSDSAPAAR
jgi:DNA-binding CsgD family transcriptional regulator